MNNKPDVSVIMCFFNTPSDYFVQSADSILKQTFKNFEFIIINDGSCSEPDFDFTCDDRIIYIKNDTNKGISYSRNLGLSMAKGKYIAIMDSDDIAFPTRLEEQFNYMESHPNVAVCGTWFEQFGEKNNYCKRVIDSSGIYKACLLFGNEPTILDPSTMLRKSILDLCNFKYKEELKIGLDYFAWVILSEYGEITNLKKVLMKYRIHKAQITAEFRNKNTSFGWFVKEYQLNKLGIIPTEKEKEMMCSSLTNANYSLLDYKTMLDSILSHNRNTNYFDQSSLEEVVRRQWHKKILHSKSIKYLSRGVKEIKGEKATILKISLRHFNPFMKDKSAVKKTKKGVR